MQVTRTKAPVPLFERAGFELQLRLSVRSYVSLPDVAHKPRESVDPMGVDADQGVLGNNAGTLVSLVLINLDLQFPSLFVFPSPHFHCFRIIENVPILLVEMQHSVHLPGNVGEEEHCHTDGPFRNR